MSEFCSDTEHTGTCAKCVYAENEKLRAENLSLQSHHAALLSAAIEVVESHEEYAEGDLDFKWVERSIADLENAVHATLKPLPSADSPNSPHPAEKGNSGT